MHFKFRHLQKIVGGFFLLACVLLIALLMLVARGQRWFQKYAMYASYFENAKGVSAGGSVVIRGMEAGKVFAVLLEPDNRIRVEFGIFTHYADRIRVGTEIALQTPLIGSGHLELILGPQDATTLPEGSAIPLHASAGEGLDRLVATVTTLANELQRPEGDLMQALKNVNGITKNLNTALSTQKGSLYTEALSAIAHLDKILAGLDESTPDMQGAIGEARKSLFEANKVIRALQQSFLLRGNIEKTLETPSTLTAEGR